MSTQVKAERFFTETVTRAHCDVVVQLSRTLRPLPHSRVENVHGVEMFFDVGAQGGPPALSQSRATRAATSLGKAMWAKGYTQLLVLLQDSSDVEIDCYGGGPELADIQNKSKVLQTSLKLQGPGGPRRLVDLRGV